MKIFFMNRYISKSYTTSKNTIYRAGAAVVSTITSTQLCVLQFERDRYDWNFEICDDLSEYNKRFPNGHSIGPEHVVTILSEPQTAFHGHPGNNFLTPKILARYCLSPRKT